MLCNIFAPEGTRAEVDLGRHQSRHSLPGATTPGPSERTVTQRKAENQLADCCTKPNFGKLEEAPASWRISNPVFFLPGKRVGISRDAASGEECRDATTRITDHRDNMYSVGILSFKWTLTSVQ